MTHATNRSIPAAKLIDDYQDAISDPSVRAPRDISGWLILSIPLSIPIVAAAMAVVGAVIDWFI